MELKSFDNTKLDSKLRACMRGYVRAKKEAGLLLMDVDIENLHPEYLQYVADTCVFELGL